MQLWTCLTRATIDVRIIIIYDDERASWVHSNMSNKEIH